MLSGQRNSEAPCSSRSPLKSNIGKAKFRQMSPEKTKARRKFLIKTAAATAAMLMSDIAQARHYIPVPPKCDPHSCFLNGTSIKTETGNVPVEALSPGQKVVTASGKLRPITWIGNFNVAKGQGGEWGRHERPVKIAKGAIDDATPKRDLWLSPGHALFIDGVLVPVAYLVNGQTIVAADPEGVETLEYFHIELETHDVIIAEGAPTETYLAPRALTADNAGTIAPLSCAPILRLYGASQRLASYLRSAAAPLIDYRTKLEVIRDRLLLRALELQKLATKKAA